MARRLSVLLSGTETLPSAAGTSRGARLGATGIAGRGRSTRLRGGAAGLVTHAKPGPIVLASIFLPALHIACLGCGGSRVDPGRSRIRTPDVYRGGKP